MFSYVFFEFLRAPLLQNTFGGLLLKIRNLENLRTLINLFPFHSKLSLFFYPRQRRTQTGIYLLKVNNENT